MKKQYIVTSLFATLVLGVLSWAGMRPVLTPGKIEGKGEEFAYVIETIGETALVHVEWNVNDPQAVHQYKAASHRRALELIQEGQNRRIDVQITFVRPVPLSVVREKVAQTGTTVYDYLMVGHSPEDRRVTSIYLGPISPEAPDILQISFPNGENAGTLVGVMVLRGSVETMEASLGKWLSDPSVFLVDTTGVEVRRLIAERHAAAISKRSVEIVLHSPFWNLDW